MYLKGCLIMWIMVIHFSLVLFPIFPVEWVVVEAGVEEGVEGGVGGDLVMCYLEVLPLTLLGTVTIRNFACWGVV